MNKLFFSIVILMCFVFSSCQKSWERWSKETQFTDRDYVVEQYSGGKLIATHIFRGTLNDAEGSDGYYFFKGDTLFEISGELIIKSTK